jgi:histone H1/5
MVEMAIKNLNSKNGSSVPAIVKFIQGKYPYKCNRAQIWQAVKRGEKEKRFARYKLRFRVSDKQPRKKKATKKKPTAPKAKSPKKPATPTKKTKAPAETPTKAPKVPKEKKKKVQPASSPAPISTPAKKKRLPVEKKASKRTKSTSSEPSGPAKGNWQYQDKGWKNYDPEATATVEKAYQEWAKDPYTDIRSVKSGQWHYQVDFNRMKQVNIEHANHTERDVRRL